MRRSGSDGSTRYVDLFREGTVRPYRSVGEHFVTDWSRLDHEQRSLVLSLGGAGNGDIRKAIAERYLADRKQDQLEAMYQAIADERVVIEKVEEGRTVASAISARFGVAAETLAEERVQTRLHALSLQQVAELTPLIQHVRTRPGDLRQDAGDWHLERTAPATLHRLIERWRHDPVVQRAFARAAASVAKNVDAQESTPVPAMRATASDDAWRRAAAGRQRAMREWDQVERSDGVVMARPGTVLARLGEGSAPAAKAEPVRASRTKRMHPGMLPGLGGIGG